MNKDQFLLAIRQELDSFLDPATKEGLRQTKDGGEYHFSLGMHIRNTWGLWKGGNDLTNYFNSIGIYHADDMSGMILYCYVKMLRGDVIRFDEQVQKYKQHWIDRGVDIKKEMRKSIPWWRRLFK